MLRTRWITTMAVLGLLALAGPCRADGIQWMDDYEAAAEKAKELDRPLLIEFASQSCGWCRFMEERTHAHPVVAEMVHDKFVPLRVMGGHRELKQRYKPRGTPTTIVAAPDDGAQMYQLRGYYPPGRYVKHLRRAQQRLDAFRQDPAAFTLLDEGDQAIVEGDLEVAMEKLNEAAEKLPDSTIAQRLLGWAHLKRETASKRWSTTVWRSS